MIDDIFRLCVEILVWLAGKTGMTYKEVNVWIFCVIWPVFTLLLIGVVMSQRRVIRRLRREGRLTAPSSSAESPGRDRA